MQMVRYVWQLHRGTGYVKYNYINLPLRSVLTAIVFSIAFFMMRERKAILLPNESENVFSLLQIRLQQI